MKIFMNNSIKSLMICLIFLQIGIFSEKILLETPPKNQTPTNLIKEKKTTLKKKESISEVQINFISKIIL